MAIVGLTKLCPPAKVYLILSSIFIIIMALQNYNNNDIYCLGYYSCQVDTVLVFIIKILYIVFWTWILNIICSAGAGAVNIAWFLVLFPYIILFILLASLMIPV
jgi:hypothetical protein